MTTSDRGFILLFICIAGLSVSVTPQPSKQVPVLCYHHIKDDTVGHSPDYTISTHLFTQHLQMMKDSGYHPIVADLLYDHLIFGTALPPKAVLITFDDGHEDDFDRAFPALQQFGFKGVFFVPTGILNDKGFLSNKQLKILSENGHVIGAHTINHPDLTKLSQHDMLIEIDSSRDRLEHVTGKRVIYFAYPYGAWNQLAIMNLKKAGIIAAFQLGGAYSKSDRVYTLRRIMVSGTWTATDLDTMLKRFTAN